MVIKSKAFFISLIVVFSAVAVLLGITKYRSEAQTKERVLDQNIQVQERVKREYIPMRLTEKNSDELVKVGANLWKE